MLGGEFDAGTVGKYIFSSIKADNPLPGNPDYYNKLKSTVKEARPVRYLR
jgi:hypothetical protein